MLIFTHDRERLHELFRRDPVMYSYHLGDLDDFFFDRCQWAASYYKSTRIDECLLLYHAEAGSTLLAFGHSERMKPLLTEALDLLPAEFYCHFFPDYREILHERFSETPLMTSLRMKLDSYSKQHSVADAGRAVRLDMSHREVLLDLYDVAHPPHYFEKRMLEVAKYFGWFEGDRLVAAAGVHVYAPEYKIAVLGNIATHPDYRGRGLATKLTSILTDELLQEGLTICLNVGKDNAPAVRCYDRIGYEAAFEFEEARFTIK